MYAENFDTLFQAFCNIVFSIRIISHFDNSNILITFYQLLFFPEYVLKTRNFEPQADLIWSKHVVWNRVVFRRILS
jgi:hypothetical protein